ncbi:MAG: GTPase HflX, partial [Candidatus Marinimicrobia bacterium]|nr:GTPase HflX [Candidatus Neomarinimicrobiota bacterium]
AGAGETQIEVDRRLIRDRISKLKRDLVKIDKERETQGKRRKDLYRVALVGYTNAGKSTLMNNLSGSDIYIQDQLFATLDTTIRSVAIDDKHKILLSDTVGFIRKLPHHLVASFRSTLKEVTDSDLIIVVLDSSSPQILDHLETIQAVLKDLKIHDKPALTVLNKIDIVTDQNDVQILQTKLPEGIMLSARDHLRLDRLLIAIQAKMDSGNKTSALRLGYHQGKLLAQAQDDFEILSQEYLDDCILLTIRGRADKVDRIVSRIDHHG